MKASNPDNGVWAPGSVQRDPNGVVVAKYPHFGPDRAKSGSIIVGPDGCRFVNEATPYQPFVNQMHERGIGNAWFIAGRGYLRNYGMGLALPAPLPVERFIRNGYLTEGATLGDLAQKIGVDLVALAATVARFDAHAKDGRDPDFDRGGNAYDQSQGDWEIAPAHPNLGPIGPSLIM